MYIYVNTVFTVALDVSTLLALAIRPQITSSLALHHLSLPSKHVLQDATANSAIDPLGLVNCV